ncbi:MAG: hypothetical protein HFG12_04150 [Oscillibacter sp.]|jgi:hypothetical protein|nr:hypothetical protein [uncultured Oscillibacter sp.]MCI8812421.1 hypothetical protein [Oscillibacter sp.]
MESQVLIAVEETLNRSAPDVEAAAKVEDGLVKLIDQQLGQSISERPSTIYEDTVFYIKRLGNRRFLRKNGQVKEAAFYQYAYIDKSTWSGLKWDQITPSKKTVLKIALALKLSESETEELLAKAHQGFEPEDYQDRLILALIELRKGPYQLDVDGIVEVLEYYQKNGPKPFDSIYDTPEMIAQRKKNF